MYIYTQNWSEREIEDYIKQKEIKLNSIYEKARIPENKPWERAYFLAHNVLELTDIEMESLDASSDHIGKVKVLHNLEYMLCMELEMNLKKEDEINYQNL